MRGTFAASFCHTRLWNTWARWLKETACTLGHHRNRATKEQRDSAVLHYEAKRTGGRSGLEDARL